MRSPGRQDVLRRMAVDGHEIGSHTLRHANLQQVGCDEMRRELNLIGWLVEEARGLTPAVSRPRYLAFNQDVLEVAGSRGVASRRLLAWASTDDWNRELASDIVNAIRARLRPGAIVALHEWPSPTQDRRPQEAAVRVDGPH
jgi:peptidoglycan/xylan/chitin deacetylase (PgdA/CDA1 family)